MSQVQFLYGSKSAYDALSLKNPNTLYFLIDTFEIYKGNDLYTCCYEVAENAAAVKAPRENYMYVFTDTAQLAIFNGIYYQYLTPAVTTTFTELTDEGHIPTVGAVRTIIATLQQAIDANKATIATNAAVIEQNAQALEVLNAGPEVEGSVANAAAAAVAEVVGGADGAFDTLKDIAEWINSDDTGAAGMKNDITQIKNTLGLSSGTTGGSSSNSSLLKRVGDLETELDALANATTDGTYTGSLEYRLKMAEKDIDTLEARPIGVTIKVQGEDGVTREFGNASALMFSDGGRDGYIKVNDVLVPVVNTSNLVTNDAFDTSIKSINNLFNSYYTKTELMELGFITGAKVDEKIATINAKFDDYYTKTNADAKFLTAKNLETYATKNDLSQTNKTFENYYTRAEAESTFLTKTHLADYVKTSELGTDIDNAIQASLGNYVSYDVYDVDYAKNETAHTEIRAAIDKAEQSAYNSAVQFVLGKLSELPSGDGSGVNATWTPIV